MSKQSKKALTCVLVILLLFGLPLLGYWALFCPHTYRVFIDRERVSEEFCLDLTDDVKLVSYYDGSQFIAIDTELTVEVDDAESFLKNNIKCGIEKGDPAYGDDYKYSGNRRIYIRIEPNEDKYLVHLNHRE